MNVINMDKNEERLKELTLEKLDEVKTLVERNECSKIILIYDDSIDDSYNYFFTAAISENDITALGLFELGKERYKQWIKEANE